MFKIPPFPETPSSVRTRGTVYHDPPESAPRATLSIGRSMSRDNLMLQSSSTSRNFIDRDEIRDSSSSSVVVANNQLAVRSFELSEDPSFWKDHNVQVIIRLRPLNSSEISTQGHSRCVRQESSQTITWTGHPESRFTFDVVADETVSQEKLFKVAGVPMVDNCVAGYNSCMFAYGQTGSGKTHTMLGDIEGGTRRHSVNCGMTPRVFEYLFTRIQKEKEARREEKFRFTCKCSFLEIYNEQILDLLSPSSLNLQIREDLKKGIYVENLTELEVTSARDVMQQLLEGATNRKVAATNMNRASSRSHSVFTCVIESTWESQGVTHHRFARLNLVDLAGSERQKSSGAEGERLKEATNINKSLSTLGLVIMNLVSISNGKNLHVPYRDSKLTFLLQDSLGGNSKTIIIANISPSNSCSLETLSTLKFAQRAKFIKNNAIINEDASGDVLAMRMQIQQLKKEVSHLRSLQNGGSGNQDSETFSLSLLGSPGAFKWEGLGAFSPLASNKRLSQKKEFEVALVGAFRREKDKDMALQALTAENKAAMQLAKQREDEIQGLKMRLRFREAGIKRLEAVASGKISAEAHLLKEKEELLREIDVLRAQVDRNQEVTRFAMENLHLKEEIRRLKSFCEDGERDRMNEQIIALQNKLLEALDWKLMHELDPSRVQKGSPLLLTDSQSDLELLNSNKESVSPSILSVKEENEFLRLQAIQNQAEIDSLQKKFDSCLVEKEKLERQTKDLQTDLEELRNSKDAKEAQNQQTGAPSPITNDIGRMPVNDQLELKAMVDAIAAASHREAEAHEMAVTLAKENEELRAKIKLLIEDNSELIDLYEKAAADNNAKVSSLDTQNKNNEAQNCESDAISQMKAAELGHMQELEHQLAEMHDENEKLMSLYEKAMQERDDLKRLLSCALRDNAADKGESECPERLVEVDEGEHSQSSESTDENTDMELDNLMENSGHCKSTPLAEGDDMDLESNALQNDLAPSSAMKNINKIIPSAESEVLREGDTSGCNMEVSSGQCPSTPFSNGDVASHTSLESNEHQQFVDAFPTIKSSTESGYEHSKSEDPEKCYVSVACMANVKDSVNSENFGYTSANVGTCPESEINGELVLLKAKLEKAREKLSSSARPISEFRVLEKAVLQIDEISSQIEAVKDLVQCKYIEIEFLKAFSSDFQVRRSLIENKLAAVRVSLSSLYSSTAYFEQREARVKARVDTSVSSLNRKKERLARLHVQSDEINARKREIQKAEAEIRNNLSCLKAKLEELNQRQESERVLLSIDNVERNSLRAGSKATELLKSEEEKTKLQNEIKQSREKLGVMKKDVEDLNMKAQKHNAEVHLLSLEMKKAAKTAEETKLALQNVVNEKEALMELIENGRTEIDTLIAQYHLCVVDDCFTEDELNILAGDIQMMSTKLDKLESDRARIVKSAAQLFHGSEGQTALPSEKLQQELEDVQNLIEEASISLSRKLH